MEEAFPNRRAIGPVSVVAAAGEEAVAGVVRAVADRRPHVFAFCNAHTVNLARAQPRFAEMLVGVTVFNDGIGLDLGSRLLHGAPFPENLNGSDLTTRVLAALEPRRARVFLLGSPPGVAERAAAEVARRFPGLVVAGTRDGFFDLDDPAVGAQVADARPDAVLVAMGQPRQEFWAVANVAAVGAPMLCVGAYLDFLSGAAVRAPLAFQRARVEWLYRLYREPRRLARRYLLGNAIFLAGMVRDRLRPPPREGR